MYVYGPVPSRRLGRSLGVSPIPSKTCSYSCVYCQLGKTNRKQIKRESFYPKEDIFTEIVKNIYNPRPDFITIVGDGEPTLFRDLGWLIRRIKTSLQIPTAIITNGSLLFRKDVRQDLQKADVVIPTLDAGDEKLFDIINRPHCGIDFGTMLKGMETFRNEYSGQIWLEVMLVKGLNDTEDNLVKIKSAIDKIRPDKVYLLTPVRPPSETWVSPPDLKHIKMALNIIKQAIPILDIETGAFELKAFDSARKAILEIGMRHPMRQQQILQIEEHFHEQGMLDRMINSGDLIKVNYNDISYYLPSIIINHKDNQETSNSKQ